MRKLLSCLALFGLFAFVPSTAESDPVRVTGGGFALDHEGHGLSFSAPAFFVGHVGFTEGGDPNIGLFIPLISDPALCFVCDPGHAFNVSVRTGGEEYLGLGRATIDGTSYPDITLRGTLDFRAEPVVLPADFQENTFFNASSPFTFSAFVRGFSGDSELFAVSLFGGGRTHVPFDYDLQLNRFFMDERGPTFFIEDTAPVPEPSTILLVGLGAAGLARARKRRGRNV